MILDDKNDSIEKLALINFLNKRIIECKNEQLGVVPEYRSGMLSAYKEILSMISSVQEDISILEKPTSEQLVELFEADGSQDITIMGDIVYGLDFEYKQLEEENRLLRQGIRDTYETSSEIIAEQQVALNKKGVISNVE